MRKHQEGTSESATECRDESERKVLYILVRLRQGAAPRSIN